MAQGGAGVELLCCHLMAMATLGGLAELIKAIVSGSTVIVGVHLLTSSPMLWVSDRLIFLLLY